MKQWHKNRSFMAAFKFAVVGIYEAYVREVNIRRQVKIFVPIIILALVLKVSVVELALLFIVGGTVLAFELMNSALEEIEDIIWPEYRESIRRSKDIAAGAVLVSSIVALIVGLLILFPPLAKSLLLLY